MTVCLCMMNPILNGSIGEPNALLGAKENDMTTRMKIMKSATDTVSHIYGVENSSKLQANYDARMLVSETVLISDRGMAQLEKRAKQDCIKQVVIALHNDNKGE